MDCETNEDLQSLFADESNIEVVSETGFQRPLAMAEIGWKNGLIQSCTLHYCLTSIQAALNQIREGLQECGLLEYMQKSPTEMKKFFCITEDTIMTSGNYFLRV